MDPVLAAVIIVAVVCLTIVAVAFAKLKGAAPLFGLGRSRAAESRIEPPAPRLEKIPFRQALESDALAGGLAELAKRQIEYALALDSAETAVQDVRLGEQCDKLVIVYERSGAAGEAMIPLRRKSGKLLPVLKAGHVVELAKVRSLPDAEEANAAALISGAAHVVYGIDVLRRLKEIDQDLSALARERSIDQLAEMETIYNRLCEIFSRANWMARRSDLYVSRDQLFKLRATWRRELDHILNSAPETPDTQAAEHLAKLGGVLFPPAFFVGKGMEMHREAEEERLFSHLSTTADLLQRIRLAMLLDISVSQALGETEMLAGVTMRNELEMWEGIVEKFQAKRQGIRTFDTPGDLQTVEDALRGYVEMLSSMTSLRSAAPAQQREDSQAFKRRIGFLGAGESTDRSKA